MGHKINLHYGDGFLMKPLLQNRDIPVDQIFTKYTKGAKKWYTREHLSRIVNGRRPIPVELAKDIAETYQFNWTEFYQVADTNVKTIDCLPCTQHDMRIVFKPGLDRLYCPHEYVDSHWALSYSSNDNTHFYGNQVKMISLFNKTPTEPTVDNILESMHLPLIIKTKDKDFFAGFLAGFSTPVGTSHNVIFLGDVHNTRYVEIKHADIKQIHYNDFMLARPKFII
tara:strand:- start:485 stop:1159 length:675 start_codon:yes stop_codon:yes gene_type:complete